MPLVENVSESAQMRVKRNIKALPGSNGNTEHEKLHIAPFAVS